MLTVTDSTGLQDTDTAQVEVLAEPEAEFEISDTTPSVGEPVTFDGSTTVNPDTTISEYRWDFGDGETARGEIVQHEYESIGNYQVRLSVLDSAGSTSTINRTIEVTAVPEAGFAYEPTQPMQGQTVRFDASRSTDLDDDIESYAWDFGDGSMSQGSAVTHKFDRYGEYPVTLTVEDSVGNTSTTTRSVQVLAAPTPSFRYQPPTPTVSDTITLDASGSSDPDDSIVSYNWDLGQGDTAQGEVVSFSYDTGGSYDVMLTTEDEAGNTASTTQTIDVIQRPEPEFVVTPSQPLQSEVITLDASNSVDPDGEVTSYRWALGDGTEKNGEVIEHIYGESGEFDVTLRVSDNSGNSATITDTVTVYAEPNAQFEYSPQEPTTSDAVTFDASGSTDDDSEALSYTWTFSNGQTDQGRVLTKMYDSPGEYEVQLTVEDNIGNSDTATRFVVVSEESGDPGGGSGPETSSAPGVGGEGRFSTREERQEEIIE
jgi:PKD repeat protein